MTASGHTTLNQVTMKSVRQLCKQSELKKEPKGEQDCCLCGKFKAMSTNADSLCCRKKNEVSDEILNGNFLHFYLYNMSFMNTEAGIQCSE